MLTIPVYYQMDKTSLWKSLAIFKEFHLCSGLKLKYEKTIAVWIGAMEL